MRRAILLLMVLGIFLLTVAGVALAEEIIGTKRSDDMRGTERADQMYGRGGNDVMNGRARNDLMDGGPDDDDMIDGEGEDDLWGSSGDDDITSNTPGDDLNGGRGNDFIDSRNGGPDLINCGYGVQDVAFVDAEDTEIIGCEEVFAPPLFLYGRHLRGTAPGLFQVPQGEHHGGHAAGREELPARHAPEHLAYRHPLYLKALVLVGVGARALLDPHGQEQVRPVVLEARRGGHGAQTAPLAATVSGLLAQLAARSSLRLLVPLDETGGQAELHPLHRRTVLPDENHLSCARYREHDGRVGTFEDVVRVLDGAVRQPQGVRAQREEGRLHELLRPQALPALGCGALSQRRPRRRSFRARRRPARAAGPA
jgi:hypothetical protein